MNKVIGVDLGGTNLRAAIDQYRYRRVFDILTSVPTLAREGHDAVMNRMALLIEQVMRDSGLKKSDIGGVGIGVPGVLDLDRGRVLFLPNLPGTWPNVPLRDTIADRVQLPTFLLNDVRAMTLGEWRFGAGRGVETIACFAHWHRHRRRSGDQQSTCILGIGGTGGELGHQTIDFNGPLCGCGNAGLPGSVCLGPGDDGAWGEGGGARADDPYWRMVDYDLNRITPQVIYEAAQAGDAIAKDIYEQAGFYIGVAVANIIIASSGRSESSSAGEFRKRAICCSIRSGARSPSESMSSRSSRCRSCGGTWTECRPDRRGSVGPDGPGKS